MYGIGLVAQLVECPFRDRYRTQNGSPCQLIGQLVTVYTFEYLSQWNSAMLSQIL